MSIFDDAFAEVLTVEGGYSDDPSDSGGATKYGIIERVARANGYFGRMRDLPLDTAKQIAKAQYWDILRLDEIAVYYPKVAVELFDTGYNMGIGTAGKFLQQTLNVLNLNQGYYSDIVEDGVVGPGTLFALTGYLTKRGTAGESVLLKALNCLQGARYINIATSRPKDEKFVYGWFDKRVRI